VLFTKGIFVYVFGGIQNGIILCFNSLNQGKWYVNCMYKYKEEEGSINDRCI